MGTAVVTRRRARTPHDVYRSDFIQDSGTPLQWLLAWELVTEREYVEALAQLAVFVAVSTGWPIASVVAAVAAVGFGNGHAPIH